MLIIQPPKLQHASCDRSRNGGEINKTSYFPQRLSKTAREDKQAFEELLYTFVCSKSTNQQYQDYFLKPRFELHFPDPTIVYLHLYICLAVKMNMPQKNQHTNYRLCNVMYFTQWGCVSKSRCRSQWDDKSKRDKRDICFIVYICVL